MKKKYFYYILFLLLNTTLLFGQKVTLTPLVVNGKSFTSGPLNLESTPISSVSLNVKVDSPAPPGDNGTINVYYLKANALGASIPSGGNGGTLLFGGGKTANRQFVISLNWNDFSTSGGYVYAEYKNATGVVYKSNNINIIKDGITSPQPQPITKNKIEIIPHGGTPLLPKYQNFINQNQQKWVINNSIPFEGLRNNKRLYTPGNSELKEETTFKDGTIHYSEVITVYVVNFLSQFENLYVDNKINSNQYLSNEENPNIITGNQASETHLVRIPGTRNYNKVTNPLNNYQWQTRIKYPLSWSYLNDQYFHLYGWKDIPGATQLDYTPPKTDTGMEYRRLILENTLDKSEIRNSTSSNIVSIIPIINDDTKNIICCDQTLTTTRDVANTIVGDYTFPSSFNQWQISEDGLNWEDIFGANNKDYLPSYIPYTNDGGRRPDYNKSKIQYYRRAIMDFTDNKHYTSNTVKVNFNVTSRSDTPTTILYPNPTTSLLNIESSTINLVNAKISIANALGNIIIPNSLSVINSKLISLDVSNLITGTYYIIIESQNSRRTLKTQLAFIKN
jgi:hypothetical protein